MPERSPTDFDLAIIGSGGGAFAAAIRATNLGKRVVMIERGTIGGTCVNTGCIPSKALLAAADARHVSLDSGRFPGIETSAGPVDMTELIDGKRALVENMRSEKYVDLIADYGWDLRHADAAFAGTADDPVLEVTDADGKVDTIRAAHYLIATGSSPSVPSIDGLADIDYLTSTTAMELDEVPESLLVLGGGYVALEQAQLFARLGSKVTMIVRSRLASAEEPEASRALMSVFADEGIRVLRKTTISNLSVDATTGEVVALVAGIGMVLNMLPAPGAPVPARRPLAADSPPALAGAHRGSGKSQLMMLCSVSTKYDAWSAPTFSLGRSWF